MKKLLFVFFGVVFAFSQNIRTDYFISAMAGKVKYKNEKESFIEGRLGYYFYDANVYSVSNRLYLSGGKVKTDNVNFYQAKISLDWVFNKFDDLKPFIGFNTGYIYYTSHQSAQYGLQTGVILNFDEDIDFEIGGVIDHPTQDTTFWDTNVVRGYASLNIAF